MKIVYKFGHKLIIQRKMVSELDYMHHLLRLSFYYPFLIKVPFCFKLFVTLASYCNAQDII